ncbi:MAG: NAD(P)H-hydrate dehydratase [Firmicutes bacterium]|nr:NAD(P)H-hydrate dehydratase [Bacillota bacterium]
MKKITDELIMNLIPERQAESHKGNFGRVLVIAGSPMMTGACILCSRAALRSGAGLVYAMVPKEIMPQIQVAVPEVIIKSRDDTVKDYSYYDAIVMGPGLTTDDAAAQLVDDVLERAECPLVLDADALNIVALKGWQDRVKDRCLRGLATVITPHMGEAERLLKDDQDFDFQGAEREEVLNELYDLTGATVVLKGNRTLVRPMFGGSLDPVYVNTTGNPGMATAGSGDVLSGMMGGLLGQNIKNAAMASVFLHGLAGDIASETKGQYGLIAGDIVESIPEAIMNILEEKNGLQDL